MKKVDFDPTFLNELSKLLFVDSLCVHYAYRDNSTSSIFFTVKDYTNDAALCDLKQFCVNSTLLDQLYHIKLDHAILNGSYVNSDGNLSLTTLDVYELSMPNNQDWDFMVLSLDQTHVKHNMDMVQKLKKGGVKK